MKKITIHRKDYQRKRRTFYDRHHETAEMNDADDITVENNSAENKVKITPERKRRFNPLLPVVILLSLLLLAACYQLFNKKEPVTEAPPKELALEDIIQQAKPQVVSVVNLQKAADLLEDTERADEPEEVGIGSGVIYKTTDTHAFIVTNHHVIKDAESVEITTSDNEKQIAKIIGEDEWTDMAVLKVPKGKINSVMKFGDSNKVRAGETAIAIGSPLGKVFAGSVSQGIISGLHRIVPVDMDGDGIYDFETNVLQTDAAINPGNSGGALINKEGKLIGINSLKISLPNVEGLSFAIPSNEARDVIRELEKNGKLIRPELGIVVEDLQNLFIDAVQDEVKLPQEITEGIVITEVEPGGSAEAAGLKTKDVIVKIDEKPMKDLIHFRKMLYYDKKIGDTINITYYRLGKQNKTTLKLTSDK